MLQSSGIFDIRKVLDLANSIVINNMRRYAKKITEPVSQGYYGEVEVNEFCLLSIDGRNLSSYIGQSNV